MDLLFFASIIASVVVFLLVMEPFRILIRLGVITVFGTNCHHVTEILSGIEVEIALPKMPK